MARILCLDCNKRISETADICPKCGRKITPEDVKISKRREWGIALISIPVFVMICIFISNVEIRSSKNNEVKSSRRGLSESIHKSTDAPQVTTDSATIISKEVSTGVMIPGYGIAHNIDEIITSWGQPYYKTGGLKIAMGGKLHWRYYADYAYRGILITHREDGKIIKVKKTAKKTYPAKDAYVPPSSVRTQEEIIDYYKQKYREVHRINETAKSNYRRNASNENQKAWDDATAELDHIYIQLEKAWGAETHKGVTKQRRELEAFTESVESGQ